MSVEKAKEFLLALKEKGADEAWTAKAAEVKTVEDKFAVIAEMAKEMGYDLTAEDVKEALDGFGNGENDLVRLDDETVEGVTGGVAQPDEGAEKYMTCPNCGFNVLFKYTGVFRPGFWFLLQYQYQCIKCGHMNWAWWY